MSPRRAALAALALIGCAPAGCATPAERAALRDLDALPPVHAPDDPAAAPPAAPPTSLADLLTLAEQRSPALRAVRWRAQAAADTLPTARKLPEPQLTAQVMPGAADGEVDLMETQLQVMQRLPWPTRPGLSADVAAAQATAARLRYEAARQRLRAQVRRPFAELAFLDRTERLLRLEERLVAQIEESARGRVVAGRADLGGLARLAVRRAELREQADALEDRRRGLRAQLRAAAGLPPNTPLPTPALEPTPEALPTFEALAALLTHNPELSVALAEHAAARAAVARAEAAGLPDFTVGAGFMNRAGMGHAPDMNGAMLMLGLTLPVWRDAYAAEADAARARAHAAHADRDQALLEAQAALGALLARWDEATRRARVVERELAPGTRSALEAALSGLAADRASLVDVLELEQQLLRFETQRARAEADRVQVLAELEALLGRTLAAVHAAPAPHAQPAPEAP